MNFKKFAMIAFALCVTLLASSATYAQGNGTISAKPLTLTAAPDIEVKIEMFEDKACTKPIANGANLSYSGGAPAAFVRFTMRNKVGIKAENFTYKRVIERDGVKVFDPAAEKISLNGNEVKTFPVEMVYFSGTSNTVEARILADIGNFVKELNETNNSAKYTVKASVVH
jgi:hypothetical protein